MKQGSTERVLEGGDMWGTEEGLKRACCSESYLGLFVEEVFA